MVSNVFGYLEATADKYPDKVAFSDNNRSVTFGELRESAYAISNKIHEQCGDIRNKPIAVYMNKGVDCIISFMGIVCSGNFYSPIDRHSPMARIKRIVDVLEPEAILYNEAAYPDDSIPGICIRGLSDSVPHVKYYEDNIDTDPLYVLFTSGSTGQPKGVTISHRGVIDYAEWLYDTFAFDDRTIFGNQAPFYFDNSILDIYSTLRCGATTCIIPETYFAFHNDLFAYLNDNKINTIFWVPSALVSVANSGVLDRLELSYIKNILFCGEVMPNKQLNIWRRRYPDALYANLYGPTEITDVCTCYIVDREFADDEPLPIGRPCRNTGIIVLNDNNLPVGKGEKGELCVRGTCLSMGYYRDFEKTDAAFVQNPLNTAFHEKIYRTGDIVEYNEYGELMYLSRKDFQIKHRGHRIELGEIETMTNAIEGLNISCAMYDTVKEQIVLFYESDDEMTEKSVYKELKSKIPDYMLPGKIRRLDKMPLNINGKIDRAYLRGIVGE